MRRRDFLARAGRAALGISATPTLPWLSSWGDGDSLARHLRSLARGLGSLRRDLEGRLVLPADAEYPQARLLFNPRFDETRPLGIVYAVGASDVARSIRWARDHGIHLTARTGGHSYAGYSTTDGLIIDLSEMGAVVAEPAGETALVGAGARLIDVYAALVVHGLALAAGSCPSVGISGLALGGGLGLASRKYGLTCDNLEWLEVVTAAGEVLSCRASENADLYWACRGGGGGNFGVATSLLFRVQPVDRVGYFQLTYPWDLAAHLLEIFEDLAASAPDELMVICKLTSPGRTPGSASAEPEVTVFGQYLGPESEMREVIAPFVSSSLGPTTASTIGTLSFLDATLFWAGCGGESVPACHLNGPLPGTSPDGTVRRAAYKAKSQFYDRPLDADGIAAAMEWIEARARDLRLAGEGALQFDALGGALNRVAPEATAFVHRTNLMHGQFLAYWDADDPEDVVDANFDWIDGFYRAMRPFSSGFAYQNYIDPDLDDWPRAYYGENLPRLVDVKRRYDPDGVFRFAQGIPDTAPGIAAVFSTRPGGKPGGRRRHT